MYSTSKRCFLFFFFFPPLVSCYFLFFFLEWAIRIKDIWEVVNNPWVCRGCYKGCFCFTSQAESSFCKKWRNKNVYTEVTTGYFIPRNQVPQSHWFLWGSCFVFFFKGFFSGFGQHPELPRTFHLLWIRPLLWLDLWNTYTKPWFETWRHVLRLGLGAQLWILFPLNKGEHLLGCGKVVSRFGAVAKKTQDLNVEEKHPSICRHLWFQINYLFLTLVWSRNWSLSIFSEQCLCQWWKRWFAFKCCSSCWTDWNFCFLTLSQDSWKYT